MNVKPGDLAIVIKTHPFYADCIGRIVTVCSWMEGRGEWLVEFVGSAPPSRDGDRLASAADHTLRPVSGLSGADGEETARPIRVEEVA